MRPRLKIKKNAEQRGKLTLEKPIPEEAKTLEGLNMI